MPNRLSRMQYDEVSFVPSGANHDDDGDGAHIMLAKADDVDVADEGNPSIGARLAKALGDFFSTVSDVEKDAAVAEAVEDLDESELIDLLNSLDDGSDDDDDTNPGDESIAGSDDDEDTLFVVTETPDATADGDATSQEAKMPNIGKIEKSALPADVQQYIADLEKQAGVTEDADIYKGMTPEAAELFKEQQATITKMLDEKEIGEAREIAKSLTFLPVNHDDDVTAKALRSLSKADPEAFAEVNRILNAANAAMQQSEVFKEYGSAAKDENTSPEQKVAKRAQEIAKDSGISIEQARVEAWREQADENEKVGA